MPKSSEYRFALGTQVLCRTGADEWSAGTIVKLAYSESDWPRGRTVPYQVRLDEGTLIFVPQDVPELCRKLTLPWWAALLAGPDRTLKKLRRGCKGKDVNEVNHKGKTALMDAVSQNWIEGVEELIKLGADVNIVDSKGKSTLHEAYIHGPAMVGLLLKAGANPNCQDTDPEFDPDFTSKTFGNRLQHRTPLHYCCHEGDLDSARLLIQGKADMNIQDAQFKTSLHLAIEEDNDPIIDVLLQSGADVNLCSIESGMKNSPLMDAAHKGKHVLAEKLVRAGANVNKVGKQDMTALHLAARRGDPRMVRILLEARADATLESINGTAFSLASKNGSAEFLQLFGVKEEESLGFQKGKSAAGFSADLRAALYMD